MLAAIAAQPDVNPYDDDVPFVEERIATQVLVPPVLEATFPASSANVALFVQMVDEPLASKRRPWMLVNMLLFCLLVLLVAGESGGLLTYEHNFRSDVLPAQATRTARNLVTTQAEKTAVANMQATATATAMSPQQLYAWATSGTPVIDDPMDKHESITWIEGNSDGASCGIQDKAYHIRISAAPSFSCIAPGSFFHDLAFQVQITIFQGDVGGVLLRAPNNANAYLCYIETEGYYTLSVIKDQQQTVLKSSSTPKLDVGRGRPHLFTVIARGSTLYLYLDKNFVDQAIDANYTAGQVGLFAASGQGPTDVAFRNVKIWEI
ncbi:hypothetical protein KSF_072590 [Reticulibacter mediterranei]|uniref:3-keto-disaccharide hydrolase domain-containing protein n=1 Tax=Reticulibacter mediterranei TaxID=2778369 RepID=A0A8J3IMB5_9CHLR|nr:hypothetical protein KSF_072590 [Reticulibacter mediterranei]